MMTFTKLTNHKLRTTLWAVVVLLTAMLTASLAGADNHGEKKGDKKTVAAKSSAAPATKGKVEITPRQVTLEAKGDSYSGSFTIKNTGTGPLRVTRVVARHGTRDESQIRLPVGVSVKWAGKATTLAPGASTKVDVVWSAKLSRAKELYGHVLVESDAPGTMGQPPRPVAVALHAERGYPILGSIPILSIMTFLPMFGLIAIFIAHLLRREDDDNLRMMTLGIQGVNLVLAVLLYMAFDPQFTRADGNDGFQFIERKIKRVKTPVVTCPVGKLLFHICSAL